MAAIIDPRDAVPIPHPPGYPFVGNIFDIDPELPIVSLQNLVKQYGKVRTRGLYSAYYRPSNSSTGEIFSLNIVSLTSDLTSDLFYGRIDCRDSPLMLTSTGRSQNRGDCFATATPRGVRRKAIRQARRGGIEGAAEWNP